MGSFLARFSRKTSSGKFIPEIDGLRFIAISWVFVYHVIGYVYKTVGSLNPSNDIFFLLGWRGPYGVHLFFIISGFILAMPFASHFLKGAPPVSLRGYFLRRLTRLEPPYIIMLTLLFPVAMIVKHISFAALAPHYGSSLFYSHFLFFPPDVSNPINGVIWSLEIEVQFYILAPLLATLFFKIGSKWLRRFAIVVVMAVAVAVQNSNVLFSLWPNFEHTLLNYIQYFLVGFLLVDIYLLDWKEQPKHHIAWDLVNLMVWPALIVMLYNDKNNFVQFLIPVAFFMIICSVFSGKYINKLWTMPLIVTIGGMCYTIYLLHYPIISALVNVTTKFRITNLGLVNIPIQLLVMTPVVMIASGIYFVMIERPCMDKNWPSRLYRYLSTQNRMLRLRMNNGIPEPDIKPDINS
jgi:peptidoglycan/LPS O-acetylase OafA/YrhL